MPVPRALLCLLLACVSVRVLAMQDDLKANITRCGAGDARACNYVGAMFATGAESAAVDQRQAFNYFLKACNGGYATGCSNLANQYYNGYGVVMDRARAVQLYQQSCDLGGVPACVDLGVIYRDGKGVPTKNPAYAAKLFQRACDLSAAACASIASMYELGVGVVKDVPRAITLYQRSCGATPSGSAEDVQKIWSRASCNVLARLK
jgi:hypothetical protein